MRSAILAIMLLFVASAASAHDYVTKDGRVITWYSGNNCCNGSDCRPVKALQEVKENGDLVVMTDDDITITVPKSLQRKLSRDMGEHVCAHSIPNKMPGTAHCFFIPGMAQGPMSRLQVAFLDAEIRRFTCRSN